MDNKLTSLWTATLDELKKTVSEGNFATILKPTFLVSFEDDIATIGAPSQIMVGLLQKRFGEQIKTLLQQQVGKDIDLIFIVKSNPHVKKEKEKLTPLFDGNDKDPNQKPVQSIVGHLPRVRPDFTFSNFAVSTTNQLAFVSAQRVAEKIGQSYNPLFIYGPVGVGKTHLMHAIANSAYQQRPDKKIIYTTSEEFTNEVVDAIRTNDTAKMKKRFRTAYVLIIDDIQFIEGKEKVQEELFHTFNILIDNGSQICLTSDRPPQEIKKIEKRLSSRFAGGLTVDVGKPDLELKTAILQKKAEKFGHNLPTDVALFMAESADDTRSLEGLLLRIITQATANNAEINLDLAEKALGHMVEEKTGHLHPDDVVKAVCDFYRVKPTQLKGPKRDAALVRARQVCMYLLYVEMKVTHMEIGNLLGGRDHTTIMHGVDKIRSLVENKERVGEDIAGIKRAFLE